ncbi:MAG: glycerophosphoryl diester phosphodiesterase membrane domain-containing protein [Dehalococcoidia bacterium]|uniref:glycerophosphoryl diester phosphodiesterase membrane domain-containing protein n=1 Tax=Candidatus Amarobacter glycogenicus TaxID=3140699 RepID=UPI001DD74DDB|nr:glycerophosphoryl diester phosphodiesterase membrane domain-containing protein [Dehalococcoidia bacterium]MBK7724288.1 glycerophosphoryl diester phosphodiesterase membrane domain-containing protein [Dehalococcoidia bacterium]MBK8559278.1 glycerophosphoryl diester phosphodiesterase membrane domain-containing protein [Dehalococcoidia bacterium]MBK9545799.1 glycerophosphoryl diester phosphodiesterase membrane domain-containing protein [Dehalococcoidia bacterium]MCC6269345.1 glycerophosphoryl di
MNPEGAPPVLVVTPPSAPRAQPTWRQALRLVRSNLKATMLPLAVIELPLSILGAAFYFYLYHDLYPAADFESFSRLDSSPSGLILALLLLMAVSMLFSLVGAGATIVAVRNLLEGRPVRLAESLDPAFTRMGGLLVLGAMFYLLLLATAAGIVVVLYFIIRWGLAIHALVLDGTGLGGSLKVSWRTLKGRMLRFIGVLLTGVLVAILVFTVGTIVFATFLAPFSADPSRTTSLVAQSMGVILFGFVSVPTGAYLAAATTIFYISAKEQSRA